MSVYLVPALASLLFKLFVLVTTARRGKVSTLFLSLICVFAIHNAVELIGYVQFMNNQSVDVMFRLYYVATIYLLMYVLLHGLAISRLDSTYTTAALIVVATGLSSSVLFTDAIIVGQYAIGYSVTALKGSHYWLFVLYVLITLSSNIAALLYRYKSADSQLESIRCLYSLFALAPIMLATLLATAFIIATNLNVNAAGTLPVATALFLAILLKGESKHKLSDIRRFLPFSPERKITGDIMELVDAYVKADNQANAYKDLHSGIEREIIFYTLNKCNNNITKATAMMGLKNRSTLYSMMNRLDIDCQQLKKE